MLYEYRIENYAIKVVLVRPCWVVPLVRVSSQYAKVAGLILVRAHTRINQ